MNQRPCKYCSKLLKVPLIHQPYCKQNPHRQKPSPRKPTKKISSPDESTVRRKMSTIPCMYADCGEQFSMKSCLIKHVRSDHDAEAIEDAQIKEFENYKSFEEWKEEEEHLTYSYYSQKSGEVKKTRTKYFYCQHDGSAKSHKKQGEADRKTDRRRAKGRVKLGGHCISSMKVTTLESGRVVVRYYPTHSHSLNPEDVKYHPMSASARALIDLEICLNKPADDIQRNVKLNGYVIEEQTGKKHKDTVVVSTKLIRNRARTMDNRVMYHQDDEKSVNLLTDNLVEDDPDLVLVYKPLGMPVQIGPEEIDDLPDSDQVFMYGFQTKEQRDMMVEGCKTIVVVGETDGTNHYGYQLLSMVVVDVDGGWPIAHCILSKSDERCLKFFFQAVKAKCPDLDVNCVITADNPKLINAMEDGFGVRLRHLLCRWHLARNLKKQLVEKANKHLFDEMFNALKIIVDAKNISNFRQSYGAFIANYIERAPLFVDYLKTHYLTKERAPKWASCFRVFPHGSIDTTGPVESFHNRLKLNYMKKRPNKRIDHLIQLLLSIAEDDLRKRVFQMDFRQSDSPVEDRHEKGLALPDSCVVGLFENMWEVKSSPKSDICYEVNRRKEDCNDEQCFSKCTDIQCPGLCAHLYHCSCDEAESLCQHIHKVHSLLSKESVSMEDDDEVDSAEGISLAYASTEGKHFREACKSRMRENLRKLIKLVDNDAFDDDALRELDEDVDLIVKNVTAPMGCTVSKRPRIDATSSCASSPR